MADKTNSGIEINIDELTNSVRNVISGDSFPTDVLRLANTDLKK